MLTHGVIEISTKEAAGCKAVSPTNYAGNTIVRTGTEILFPFPDEASKRDKLYYIIDPAEGEVPGEGSAVYYCSANHWPNEAVNPPVLTKAGLHTIALKVSSYGKLNSKVIYLRYFVAPSIPSGIKAAEQSYNSIRLTWDRLQGVSGYRIYRKEGSSAAVLHRTAGKDAAAFTDTGLKTGTVYTYTVKPIAKKGTETYEFPLYRKVSAKTALKTPAVRLRSGKKKITVKWGRIAGADGYVIYRSNKRSSGYKKVRTITKGSTVSFVNKKLKKKKTYYYKIRAYRNVNGRKVYSSYSAVKKCKTKK